MRRPIFYIARETRRTLSGASDFDVLNYFYTLEEAKEGMYELILDMVRCIDTGDKTAEEYVEAYYRDGSRDFWDDCYERYTVDSVVPF